MLLKYYKKKILKKSFNNIFIQRPEVLLSVRNWNFKNTCYRFAGLENPLTLSKYWYAQYIAKYFDEFFFKSLKPVKVILGTGDESAIIEMIARSKGIIDRESVIQFPTRINTDIFKPIVKNEARAKLNIYSTSTIIVTTGRLAVFKGWKFMIDSFSIYEKEKPGSKFYFVGEGEDLSKIEEYILSLKLEEKVILVGKNDAHGVALYLNAADLFIMGSYVEGWSTSLNEAIASGTPACVTNFSSAKAIIIEGKNGFIIEEHDSGLFAQGMLKALEIPSPVYNENVMAYAVDKLKNDLLKKWDLI